MSMDIEFDDRDYYTYLNWYEMLFASQKRTATNQDIKSLAKMQMFATQYAQDMKFIKDTNEGKR